MLTLFPFVLFSCALCILWMLLDWNVEDNLFPLLERNQLLLNIFVFTYNFLFCFQKLRFSVPLPLVVQTRSIAQLTNWSILSTEFSCDDLICDAHDQYFWEVGASNNWFIMYTNVCWYELCNLTTNFFYFRRPSCAQIPSTSKKNMPKLTQFFATVVGTV